VAKMLIMMSKTEKTQNQPEHNFFMQNNNAKIIEIFDRNLVRRNRNRAAPTFGNYDFLINRVNADLIDRLQDIKRTFPKTLLMGGRGFKDSSLTNISGIQDLVIMDLAENFLDPDALSIQGDEEYLPFAPETFDLILSPLSLHTTNDMPGALIQMNRALKPDGVCLAALLGGETLYELRQIMMQAEMKIRRGAGSHIAPFADKQQIGSLMQRGGFALPVVDSEIITVSYKNVRSLMQDLRGMGEGNSLKERGKPLNKTFMAEIETLYHKNFPEENGRIRATFEIIFLIGWSPHQSQQKPLRPGSAKTRLADALETKEIRT